MLVLVAETDLGGAVIFFMVFVMMLYLATGKHSILIGGGLGGSVLAVVDICFEESFQPCHHENRCMA